MAIPIDHFPGNSSGNSFGKSSGNFFGDASGHALGAGAWSLARAADWRLRKSRASRKAAMAASPQRPGRCRGGYWRDVSHQALSRFLGATAVSTGGHDAAHPVGWAGCFVRPVRLPRRVTPALLQGPTSGLAGWTLLLRICSPPPRRAEGAAAIAPMYDKQGNQTITNNRFRFMHFTAGKAGEPSRCRPAPYQHAGPRPFRRMAGARKRPGGRPVRSRAIQPASELGRSESQRCRCDSTGRSCCGTPTGRWPRH